VLRPDAAVEARVCKGWNKFAQFVSLLNNKDLSSYEREIIQKFVHSYMLHNSET